MDTESRQNKIRALGDLLQLKIGRHVHRRGDGEDLFGLDFLQGVVESVAVFIQVYVSVDEHNCLSA